MRGEVESVLSLSFDMCILATTSERMERTGARSWRVVMRRRRMDGMFNCTNI